MRFNVKRRILLAAFAVLVGCLCYVSFRRTNSRSSSPPSPPTVGRSLNPLRPPFQQRPNASREVIGDPPAVVGPWVASSQTPLHRMGCTVSEVTQRPRFDLQFQENGALIVWPNGFTDLADSRVFSYSVNAGRLHVFPDNDFIESGIPVSFEGENHLVLHKITPVYGSWALHFDRSSLR